MKWVLVIIALIAGLIAIAGIAGAMLPRDHVATMTATIPASPDQVWAALTDVAAYPSWRKDLRRVEVLSTSPLSWREHGKQGSMTLTIETFEPPRHMVGRIKDEGMPFGGAWEYVVDTDSADPGKSRVTITERGWVSNPVFRFVSKYVMGHYTTLDGYLRALGRRFGADVVPARA